MGSHWLVRLLTERMVRLLWLLPLSATLAFTLASLAPTDPIEAFVGARTALIGPEQRELIAQELGLYDPAYERFLIWAGNALSGDLGVSSIYRVPVWDVIRDRFAATVMLLGAAWVLSAMIGFGLGLTAGAWPGTFADRTIRSLAVVLASSPAFWVAMLLIAVFAVVLNWLPACCAAPPGTLASEVSLGQQVRHMLLPVATLSVVGMAPLILHTRQRQIDMMQSPASDLLLAHGASRMSVAFGPGIRHAAGPAVALHMAGLGELFGGSVLAETVFGWPGLGQATVQSALRHDAPLLIGIAMFTVLFVFLGNLLADVIRNVLDPRLRQGVMS